MTPATAFLKAKEVPFTEHTYQYVEHGGTEVPALALRVPEHQIVKTLVMEDEAKKPLVVLMHGDRKVSTKNLARQAGRKSVEPCAPEVAQRHTGYQIGALPEIYINGGRRGLLVRIRSADLARVLSVSPVDVALS